MIRLTKVGADDKGNRVYYQTRVFRDGEVNGIPLFKSAHTTKLGKLEDIEEKINFSAEIVLKALLNGIYCTHKTGERNYYSGTELHISGNHEALVVYENNVYWITRNGERIKQQRTIYKRFEFKDYKKTWWLKEDLSE